MKWENKKFIDFIQLQRGHDLTREQFIDGPYPVVSSTSIMGYHNQYKADGPGVVIGRSGTLGKAQYINDNYWPHNTTLYVKDYKGNYPRFVYYFLINFSTDKHGGGSAVPTLNRNTLSSINIKVPDFTTQKRIANILSAYDDLIENNQKQIKLLEEAAMRLYKEWFVYLRFPGHEKSIIENSIPEDWKIVQLGEISDFKYGKMPKKDKIKDTGYPIFSGYGIVGYYDEFMFENEMLILVARGVGGTGDVKLSPCRCYLTNLSIAFLLHEEKHKYFLYQQYQYKNLRELDTGAAQSQITIENLKRHKTILPSIKIIEDFNRFFQPLHDKVLFLTEQINMLQAARDKLLPKLMSGEIEV
jgi:type I restriction enzyme S subunit